MILFVLAYLAGVLTIVSPCILPVLPFVFAQGGQPFRRNGLSMLVGMAFAFAATASLAAFAGDWAIDLNRHGRIVALALIALFGLALLYPGLSARLTAPLVTLGSRLRDAADERAAAGGAAIGSSVLLGIATGLIWAPCAGPVLGLILAGAALGGPSLATFFLLLAYACGAATSLAMALLFGNRVFATMKSGLKLGQGLRRGLGAGIIASALAIALGFDTGFLAQISLGSTTTVESRLIDLLRPSEAAAVSMVPSAQPADKAPAAPLFGATQWINSPPLTTDSVEGKVVLVNFWTYSCINCLRTLPHIRAWAEKYRDQGLVVIGVHTPEFAFEKDIANVSKAVATLGINYPVAIDNDFGIWRAFGNRAWPALYFIDTDGRVRDHVLGEGNFEESERLIEELLNDTDRGHLTNERTVIDGKGPQAPADQLNLRSGETYIGYFRLDNFASPGGVREDAARVYQHPATLPLNYWSLSGGWTVGSEFATLADEQGSIAHRFHARDLHLVLAPPSPDRPVRFRVTIDGAAPGADHGSDIDAEGWGEIREDRLYQLVRQSGAIEDRNFKIEFFAAGVRAYAFTFG